MILTWRQADIEAAESVRGRGVGYARTSAVVRSRPRSSFASENAEHDAADGDAPTTMSCHDASAHSAATVDGLRHRANTHAIELLKWDAAFAMRLQTAEPVLVRAHFQPLKRQAHGKESPMTILTPWLDTPGKPSPPAEPIGTRGPCKGEQAKTSQEHADRRMAAGLALVEWATETRVTTESESPWLSETRRASGCGTQRKRPAARNDMS